MEEKDIIIAASDECLTGMAETIKGKKPDFTITDANLAEVWNDLERGNRGFVVEWETKSAGFGTLTIYHDNNDGILHMDAEAMGLDFCKKVLAKLIDKAKDLEGPSDCKHEEFDHTNRCIGCGIISDESEISPDSLKDSDDSGQAS
jgi:hypothetical protein